MSRYHQFWRITGWRRLYLAGLCLIAALPATAQSLVELKQRVQDIPFAPVQLDFARFLADELDTSQAGTDDLSALRDALLAWTPDNACERIDQQQLLFRLSLIDERRALRQASDSPRYGGDFKELQNGQAWYRHWLKSWLLEDVSLEKLEAIARAELNELARQRRARERTSVATLPHYPADSHEQIVAALRQRETIVMRHLSEILDLPAALPAPSIQRSSLPADFPAPGIYDPSDQIFIYHPKGNSLAGEHLDWLYLHEAVPGHHLQNIVGRDQPLCAEQTPDDMPMASVEGWAAYAETLGAQVGLLKHPDSRAYLQQWQTLRALRVLIDIGLHARGWSKGEAEALWQRHLPGQEALMRREIARVKRWPAQAITYVYGKHRIEQTLLNALEQHPAHEAKTLRTLVLRLSHLPPAALDEISAFLPQLELDHG
jgi:hypothetical protein